MVHFVVTYANDSNDDKSYFDFDYYLDTHLPMADRLLKEFGLVETGVEKGLPNSRGENPAYACITRLYFSDIDRMTAGFAEHGSELREDIRHYTNIQPVFTLVETLD